MPIDEGALDDIRAAFEDVVGFRRSAGTTFTDVAAVKMNRRGPDFLGPADGTRQTIYQIAFADWATAFGDTEPGPVRGDVIRDGDDFAIIDVVPREDVAAWDTSVEAA